MSIKGKKKAGQGMSVIIYIVLGIIVAIAMASLVSMSMLYAIFGIIVVMLVAALVSLIAAWLITRTSKETTNEISRAERTRNIKDFWWNYFKPLAAVPIGWYILHIVVWLMFPETAKAIWGYHLQTLLAVEIIVFVLNSLLNKQVAFRDRNTRKLMEGVYITFLVMGLLIILTGVFAGECKATIDMYFYSRIKLSEVAKMEVKIEIGQTEWKSKPSFKELNQLSKEISKRPFSDTEMENVRGQAEEARDIISTMLESHLANLQPSSDGQNGQPAGPFKTSASIIQNPDGSWDMPVLANRLEIDSTLEVKEGQVVIITASGQVNGCKSQYDAAYGWTGPEGRKWDFDPKRKRPLGPGSPFMALGAKIGENGKWFKVGKKINFRATEGGKLYFTVNDDIHDSQGRFRPGWIKDNEGQYTVKIKIDC